MVPSPRAILILSPMVTHLLPVGLKGLVAAAIAGRRDANILLRRP